MVYYGLQWYTTAKFLFICQENIMINWKMYSFLHSLFSGVPIKECVGLLPKMYSITYDITETDNNVLEKKSGKGNFQMWNQEDTPKCYVQKLFVWGNYYNKFNEMHPKSFSMFRNNFIIILYIQLIVM